MMVAMALWMLAAVAGLGAPHVSPATATPATPPPWPRHAYMVGMERMNRDMNVPMTGDEDRDFAAMMIPHHEGAIGHG